MQRIIGSFSAVALECLQIINDEYIYSHVQQHENCLYQLMQEIADLTKKITNVRNIGAIVAADLITAPNTRSGYAVYRKAIELGAFLRPLGNTIYWCLPLNSTLEIMQELQKITYDAVCAINMT